MTLVLRPSIKEFNEEELREHIAGIRNRRMALAFDHQAGQMLELSGSRRKVEIKFAEKNTQLGRALAALDKAMERVETLVNAITELRMQDSHLDDLINAQKFESNTEE